MGNAEIIYIEVSSKLRVILDVKHPQNVTCYKDSKRKGNNEFGISFSGFEGL